MWILGLKATTTATETKTSLKSEVALLRTLSRSISFNSSNVGNFFWSLILKDCIEVQGRRKKAFVLCSHHLHENKHFHVVN